MNRKLARAWISTITDDGAPDNGGGEDPGTDAGKPAGDPAPPKTFTQSQVDQIVSSAKAKERAKYEKPDEAKKPADQGQTDALTALQTELDEMKAENARAKVENNRLAVMSKHNVTAEYAGLVGTGTPDEQEANAKALGELLVKIASADAPGGRKPPTRIGQLRPGATPGRSGDNPDGSAGRAEAERRFGKKAEPANT